jgi:NitT/TauT family transport system substrate-binding protein
MFRRKSLTLALVLLLLAACGGTASQPSNQSAKPAPNQASQSAKPAAQASKPSSNQLVPIRFGILNSYFDAPSLIAKQEGLFRKAGLQVRYVPFTIGRDAVNGLVAGAVDIAVVGAVPFVVAASKADGKIVSLGVSVYYGKGQSIVVKKGAHIRTLADLRGKKIGMYVGSSTWNAVVNQILPGAGLKPGDYQVVNMEANLQIGALTVGNIQAFAGTDPYPVLAVQSGVGRVLTDLSKYDPSPSFYAVHSDFVQQHPQTVEKFLEVILKADQMYKTDPGGASEAVRSYMKTVQLNMSAKEARGLLADTDPTTFYMPKMNAYLDNLAKLQAKSKNLHTIPDWNKILLTSYLDRAAKAVHVSNPYAGS